MDIDTRRVAWRALTGQCKAAYACVDDGPGRTQYESLILAYCDGVREAISGELTTPAIWHCACAMQMVRHAVCGPHGSAGVFNTDYPPSDHLAAALHRIMGLCTAEVASPRQLPMSARVSCLTRGVLCRYRPCRCLC